MQAYLFQRDMVTKAKERQKPKERKPEKYSTDISDVISDLF